MKRYLFTILIIITFVTGAPFVYGKIYGQDRFSENFKGVEKGNDIVEKGSGEVGAGNVMAEKENEAENMDAAENAEEHLSVCEFETVERSYFDDALFIGDSRTVGLFEYADLGNADVYADSGMNVYKVFDIRISMKGQGKLTLSEVLSAKQYGKIYLMMGINELGYDFEKTVKTYREMVETIKGFQPEAIIFLEANQHVTAGKSNGDAIFNNKNINGLNERIRELADNRTTFYIDVNELFDDAKGNLDASITNDGVHVLGKYYARWADWLCTKGVRKGD